MAIDFATDLKKHYVRTAGWLGAAIHRGNRTSSQKRRLKYLTFCAVQAVDVFMLEYHSVIARDPRSGRLTGVYFCEQRDEAFAEIERIFGAQNGFLGELTEIVLFADDATTKGRRLLDTESAYDEQTRARLRLKDANQRLTASFPFDIINLDLDGSMFPANEPLQSRLVETIRTLFRWQTTPPSQDDPRGEFTLFITTKLDPNAFSAGARKDLVAMIDKNRNDDSDYDAAFTAKYGSQPSADLAQSAFHNFCAVGLPKKVLEEATSQHWKLEYRHIFLYQRTVNQHDYHMLSLVCHFRRSDGDPIGLARHTLAQAVQIIRAGPVDVDQELADKDVADRVQQDLDAVIRFRNSIMA